MAIQLLNLSEEEAKGILPDYMCYRIADGKHYIYVNQKEDRLCAIAVFSESVSQSGRMVLEYIQVERTLRRMGYGHELIEYCSSVFAKAGKNRIYCKCCDTPAKLSGIYQFLLKEKFIPLVFEGHMVEYYVEDMLNNETIKRILEKYEQIPNVVELLDSRDPLIKDFQVRCKEIRSGSDWNVFDMKWSRFYMHKGEIVMAMLGTLVKEDTLYLPVIYIDKTKADMKTAIMLLAACIREATQKLPRDAKIQLQMVNHAVYKTVTENFGIGENERLVQEYVRVLHKD